MDKFEQEIQKKFENFSVKPPSHIWQNINYKIKPWYKTSFAKILLITSTIIGLFTSIFIINNLNTKQTTQPQDFNNIIFSKFINNIRQPHQNSQKLQTITQKSKYVKKKKISSDTSHNTVIKTVKSNNKIDIDTNNKNVFENPISKKKLSIKYNVNPHTGCEPLTVNFNILLPQNMSCTWFINKQPVSEDSSFSYTLSQGKHLVQLVIFDQEQTIIIYDTITVYNKPTAEFVVDKCTVEDTVNIKNLSINANKFTWIFDNENIDTCLNPIHIFSLQGIHKITMIASNEHCADTVSHLINVLPKEEKIIFPNAFIPDITGENGGYYNPNKPVNNIFHPIVKKPVKEYTLKIFDRRGKLLFESRQINRGWDGYYKNKLVPVGVYLFIAQGVFEDGETFDISGDITVIYKK